MFVCSHVCNPSASGYAASRSNSVPHTAMPVPDFAEQPEGQDDVAALSFSGEVQKTEVTKTFARAGFNCLGNCTPTALTLGDITADENFANSASSICFMTAGNANAKVEFDGVMEEESYVYWPADWSPAQGAGWYLGADWSASINCNDIPLRAGEGFMVQCAEGSEKDGETEASITIPAAYEEK